LKKLKSAARASHFRMKMAASGGDIFIQKKQGRGFQLETAPFALYGA